MSGENTREGHPPTLSVSILCHGHCRCPSCSVFTVFVLLCGTARCVIGGWVTWSIVERGSRFFFVGRVLLCRSPFRAHILRTVLHTPFLGLSHSLIVGGDEGESFRQHHRLRPREVQRCCRGLPVSLPPSPGAYPNARAGATNIRSGKGSGQAPGCAMHGQHGRHAAARRHHAVVQPGARAGGHARPYPRPRQQGRSRPVQRHCSGTR